MFDDIETNRAVVRGNQFFQRVMEWDREKATPSKTELESALNALLTEFLQPLNSRLHARLHFDDVHARMGKKWHTELAFVEFNGTNCDLYFDHYLYECNNPHAGLIFIAKSWVLLLVLVEALSKEPALSDSFVFEIGDNATLGEVGFTSTRPDACLILDYDFAASNGYADYRRVCDTQLVPWEDRTAKIFWRGSTTGRRLY